MVSPMKLARLYAGRPGGTSNRKLVNATEAPRAT
jgi:hypothetical protein